MTASAHGSIYTIFDERGWTCICVCGEQRTAQNRTQAKASIQEHISIKKGT